VFEAFEPSALGIKGILHKQLLLLRRERAIHGIDEVLVKPVTMYTAILVPQESKVHVELDGLRRRALPKLCVI
jgi:hypothetical protein